MVEATTMDFVSAKADVPKIMLAVMARNQRQFSMMGYPKVDSLNRSPAINFFAPGL
jgi:hypothetical protein